MLKLYDIKEGEHMGLTTVQEIERAIDALTPEQMEELHQWLHQRYPQPTPPELEALRRKNFVQLCDPVRGLAEDIDFSRNQSTARPLDL
jgi:hypothetical protein